MSIHLIPKTDGPPSSVFTATDKALEALGQQNYYHKDDICPICCGYGDVVHGVWSRANCTACDGTGTATIYAAKKLGEGV